MRTASSLLLLACALALAGCRHVVNSEASTDLVMVVNGTAKNLKVELAMDWDGVRFEPFPSPGYMNPGVDKGIDVASAPLPVRTRVSWTDPAAGVEHHQDVEVRAHGAPRFKGDVIFTIRPDATVALSFKPR